MRLRSLTAAAACIAAASASAQSLKPDEVYSSIAVRALSEPNPVLGADNQLHLAYELLVSNPSALFITIDKVEAIDNFGYTVSTMTGGRLVAMMKTYPDGGTRIPPGGTAAILMNVTFGATDRLPESVAARISATRQSAGSDGKPAPMPADTPLPATITFTGAATPVGQAARVIEPPLRGPNWVVANGCCDSITSHRGAVMSVNGVVRVPERFAIDWIQLDKSDRAFTGDISKLSSYAYYGAPIYSVAPGIVVNMYDGADEQVPGAPVKGLTLASIGGNMLVVDIGNGAYAFYAHLQRGSLKAKLGDRVVAGQVLGLLGNTGNSTAPHLHFHLMDGTSPLNANSLPFVFTKFSSRGVLRNDDQFDAMLEGKQVQIDTTRLSGNHVGQLPLNVEVVDFGN